MFFLRCPPLLTLLFFRIYVRFLYFPLYKLVFVFTIVNFPSDSFPISHVHAILNLSLSARFSHGADLFFFRKGFIYEAYQKYRSAPCGGDPLHYAVSLLRSVRAAMAVAYSHPHTSDSWSEVGVTLFFLLSGYGIYLSLSSSEARGCLPGWRAFMKKRCIRIMPQYYVCITVLLIFMSTQMF